MFSNRSCPQDSNTNRKCFYLSVKLYFEFTKKPSRTTRDKQQDLIQIKLNKKFYSEYMTELFTPRAKQNNLIPDEKSLGILSFVQESKEVARPVITKRMIKEDLVSVQYHCKKREHAVLK